MKTVKLEVGCFYSQGKPRVVETGINCYSSGRKEKRCVEVKFAVDRESIHAQRINSGEIHLL